MKIGSGRSKHEQLIAAYARNSFSSAGLFHPNQWSNGREPADLVLKVGKSVFLFNMYKGNQWFETACLHNLDQAAERMSEWKNGRPIRGSNAFKSFVIAWEDIENIAVISVVDGKDSGCCHHHPNLIGHREKLTSAITITGNVLKHLAFTGGGARELAMLSSHLCASPGLFLSSEINRVLTKHRDTLFEAAWDARPRRPQDSPGHASRKQQADAFRLAFRYMWALLITTGQSTDNDIASDVFCQLGWLERASLASVIAEFAPQIWNTVPGDQVLAFYSDMVRGPLKFGIGVGNSDMLLQGMKDWAPRLDDLDLAFQWIWFKNNKTFSGILIFGENCPKVLDDELTGLRLSLSL